MEKAIQYLTELAERITQNTGVTVKPSDTEKLAVDLSIQGNTFAKIFFDTAKQTPVYQSDSHTVDSVDEMKNAIEDDLSNSITLNEVKPDDSSYEHDDDITNTFVRFTENKDEAPAYGDDDLELTEIPAGLAGAFEGISNKPFRKAVMEMYSACFKDVVFESIIKEPAYKIVRIHDGAVLTPNGNWGGLGVEPQLFKSKDDAASVLIDMYGDNAGFDQNIRITTDDEWNTMG